jgi:hypothetical protein
MMGLGERGVPICITTLRAPTGRIETLNGIALPFVPAGTIWFTLAGGILVAVFILAMLRRLPQILVILFVLYPIGSCVGHQ